VWSILRTLQNLETTPPDQLFMHFIGEIDVYLYSTYRAENYLWQQEEICKTLMPRLYGANNLRKFSAERAAMLERPPYELFKCFEKRGDDAKNWGA
jgi:hypothetical protein